LLQPITTFGHMTRWLNLICITIDIFTINLFLSVHNTAYIITAEFKAIGPFAGLEFRWSRTLFSSLGTREVQQ
jgi:hypothetical protein